MRSRAPALLVLALAACTGQNVDESFVSTHGALLARVDCVCSSGTCGTSLSYSALMFLDGSVLASGKANGEFGLAFHERSEAAKDEAQVGITPADLTCGAPGAEYFAIEGGDLNLYTCSGSPPAHVVDETRDLATDCSGFNKGLFD